jgi:sRNA-binding carbon storage regulator CsrA
MLMLTRSKGQAVDITDSRTGEVVCRLVVLETFSDRTVRLGFDAPRHISILRDNAVQRDSPRPQSPPGADGTDG